jgi:hypothetical protein
MKSGSSSAEATLIENQHKPDPYRCQNSRRNQTQAGKPPMTSNSFLRPAERVAAGAFSLYNRKQSIKHAFKRQKPQPFSE